MLPERGGMDAGEIKSWMSTRDRIGTISNDMFQIQKL